MAFHGLMLLRDEEDVIGQCLDDLLKWIDSIFILDLGSTDRTWEIVQNYANRDSRIVPFERAPIIYNDNLRSYLFHHFRNRFRQGDWIMKVDADEFYQIAPPTFVSERVATRETAVSLQWYFFRLTQQEVADYASGKVNIATDRERPITDRRRYYQISSYAEPRMFRYRRSMQWPENISFPYNAGYVARERIPIRHYPHRDPAQMEQRFKLRAAIMKINPAATGAHWKLENWQKEVVDSNGVSESGQARTGLGAISGLGDGQLFYWAPGTPLPEHRFHNHLPNWKKRSAQYCIHRFLLPYLDRRRASFNPQFRPPLLPEHVQREIAANGGM